MLESLGRRPDGRSAIINSWVTNLVLTPETVAAIVGIGAPVGRVENEQFNVQKITGYEIEPNYGHGQQTLSDVFYLLNLLAFLRNQLLSLATRL